LVKSNRNKRAWWVVLLWVALAARLLVQAFAPQLKIQNNKFIIPPALLSGVKEVRPDEIITRERGMQALSGILTLSGALCLGFYIVAFYSQNLP
jgi:hypothetical protein